MRQVALGLVLSLLAFAPARGDDPPQDKEQTKEEKKELTPKEKYQALVKEFGKQQSDILKEAAKKKDEEQQKLYQKYFGLGKEFAGRFAELAKEHADDPVASDVYFWIVQNAAGADEFKDAIKKVRTLVGEMPLKDLRSRLNGLRNPSNGIVAAVMERAEKDSGDAESVDLLGWVATSSPYDPAAQKAGKLLIEKDPDHSKVDQLCQILGYGYKENNVELLKIVLEKSTKDNIKASAALALGKALYAHTDSFGDKVEEGDKIAAEAEKYLKQVIEEYGNQGTKKKAAEKELQALRTLRVGKEAPEIQAGDLEGTEFKLSDYRGKVVLLDFWGHW